MTNNAGKAYERFSHKLATEAMIAPCPHVLMVNHEDGIKLDPSMGDLEFTTVGENNLHAFRVIGWPGRGPKLDRVKARDIRSLKGTMTPRQAAAIYGVHVQTSRDIWSGTAYRQAA